MDKPIPRSATNVSTPRSKARRGADTWQSHLEALEDRTLLAGEPIGPIFQLHQYTANNQSFSTTARNVAIDANGNFFAVWTSEGQDGSGSGVYARRFANDATPLGDEFRVNSLTTGNQDRPVIAMSTNGEFVIAWASFITTGTSKVFAQRYSSAGEKLGAEIQVGSQAIAPLSDVQIDAAPGGGFAVGYGYTEGAAGNTTYLICRYDENGLLLGNALTQNIAAGSTSTIRPWFAFSKTGEIVLAFFGGNGGTLVLRGFDSNNNYLWERATALTTTGEIAGMAVGAQQVTSIVTSSPESRLFRFDHNGQLISEKLLFFDATSIRTSFDFDDDGDFIGVSTGASVVARRFTRQGDLIGASMPLSGSAPNLFFPRVAMNDHGQSIALWRVNAPGDFDIVGRRLESLSLPPRVFGVFQADGIHPIEASTLPLPLSQLVVVFEEAMSGNVTDRQHWRLWKDGVDRTDRIDSIAYGFNTTRQRYEATVSFLGALLEGSYRIDLEALPTAGGATLDGDGDGIAGGSFSRSFSVDFTVQLGSPFQLDLNSGVLIPTFRMNAGGQILAISGNKARRFDSSGNPLTPEMTIAAGTGNVAFGDDGGFVVTWVAALSSTQGAVYARAFLANGSPRSGQIQVNTTLAGSQTSSWVSMDQYGRFVVTWNRKISSDQTASYFRLLSSDGILLSPETQLQPTSTSINVVGVSMRKTGEFAVFFQDSSAYYGQLYNVDGLPISLRYQIVPGPTTAQPLFARYAQNVVVVWQDSTGLWYRRFADSGAMLDIPRRLKEFEAVTSGSFPFRTLSAGFDGRFVVAGQTISGGSRNLAGVYVQAVGANDQVVAPSWWLDFHPDDPPATELQFNIPWILHNGAGDFTVVWEKYRGAAVNSFFAQRFVTNRVEPPTASIESRSTLVRGEEGAFTFRASHQTPNQADVFSFHLDWDNDGTFDQVVTAPSGVSVSRRWSTTTSVTVRMVAVDSNNVAAENVYFNLNVVPYETRANGATFDLYWGGTDGIDAVFFTPWISGVQSLTFIENSVGFPSLPFGARSIVHAGVNGRIVAFGQGQADLFVAASLAAPVEFHGGDGDDVLVGGTGGDYLEGGAGADLLLGGALALDGADTILGGEGNDILFGGAGGDVLFGGSGSDLILAGALNFADLSSAVYAIRAEWNQPTAIANRVAHLQGQPTGANGATVLTSAQTALDDGSIDYLLGSEGDDWFLYDLAQDLAPDVGAGDLVTGI